MKKENVFTIDAEDFEDLIVQIEDSFKIQFEENEICNNMSIKQFSNIVISRMNMKEGLECSSQIAFYKIRKVLVEEMNVDKNSIHISTELKSIFLKKDRIINWKNTFGKLNFHKINLDPSPIPYGTFILVTFIPFFFLFSSYWYYAIPIFIVSFLSTKLLVKYGKVLPVKTVGELSNLVVQNNYSLIRENKGTINIKEVKTIILEYFKDWSILEDTKKINISATINYLD